MSAGAEGGRAVASVASLLAHAVAIGSEASERYDDLAEQMAIYHNAPLVAFFRRLAKLEQASLGKLEILCRGIDLPRLAPWEYQWAGAEGPKGIGPGCVHYRMSPREAAALALEHQRQATAFYAGVAAVPDDEVRDLAHRLAAAEATRLHWLDDWLAACGPGANRGIDDPDPPNSLE